MAKKIKFNIPYFDKDHLKNHNFLYKNQKFSGNNVFSKSVKNFIRKNNFKNVLLTDSSSSSFEIIATSLRDSKKRGNYSVI